MNLLFTARELGFFEEGPGTRVFVSLGTKFVSLGRSSWTLPKTSNCVGITAVVLGTCGHTSEALI